VELRQRVTAAIRAQFGHPTGFWGRAAGLLMAQRLFSGPVRRFFDSGAVGWDERVRSDSPEYLEPLVGAGGDHLGVHTR
jgi:hypothetical protein